MKKSLFVAVGQDGVRVVSTDGSTWSKPELGKDGQVLRAVAFCNGIALAVGSSGGDNLLCSTTDGSAWKVGSLKAGYVQYLRGLTVYDAQFLGFGGDPGSVGNANTFLRRSKDGHAWDEPVQPGGKNLLRRIADGNGILVGVGDRGRRSVSKNFKTWVDVPDVKAADTLIDIAFGNNVFVGVGLHGLRMSSANGQKWEHRQTGEEGEHLNTILFTGEQFVAIGAGATYFSQDGQTWKKSANENAPLAACLGNKLYVGVAWKGKVLMSTDAVKWKQVLKLDTHLEAIGFGEIAGK